MSVCREDSIRWGGESQHSTWKEGQTSDSDKHVRLLWMVPCQEDCFLQSKWRCLRAPEQSILQASISPLPGVCTLPSLLERKPGGPSPCRGGSRCCWLRRRRALEP